MAQLSIREVMMIGRMLDRVESELKANETSLSKLDVNAFADESAYDRRLRYLESQKLRLEFILNGLNSLVED